ncbi:translocation and assembly module lipoprotein TamL [Gaetbulibacter saemankumensis]|uniref:translocation and assembly module lipoprotein TamL n=1 Tax=Gaetbulibacter saemankumensis TaxID=311208 RepID=UPI00041B515A|nr:BamA/TamA family outer membrane protein [Gaetbulibacter saemankumensis]
MIQLRSKILILTTIIVLFLSCNAVKRVGDDEQLLTKNTVIIDGKKNNTEAIKNLISQNPNSKIPVFGIPLRLNVYNLARPNIDSILNEKIYENPKKLAWKTKLLSRKQLDQEIKGRKSFNKWLKKTGEAPVIINDEKTNRSIKKLNAYHINNGWFNVETNYKITNQGNKRAEITYEVEKGSPFILDSITADISSVVIDSLYENIKKNSLIKSNQQYKTVNFEKERERISSELRNSGIYHFSPEYVTFKMDTIGTNKKVNVDIQILDRAIRTQDSIRREPFKIYTIADINIITDYSFENRNKPFQDSIKYAGYKIYAYDKIRYRPKALTDAIFLNRGNIFKDSDRTLTYRHLNELRTFKYPNIEYTETPNNSLADTIRLSPLKRFNLGFSADISQSNIQTFGISLHPSLLIRNIFRGAETLEISAFGSIGASKDKNNINDPFFDINEYGLDLNITIPRFFFPVNTERIIPKYMSPKTRINMSMSSQTNIGLDKQTLSGNLSYNWQPSSKVTDRLEIFNVQYVRNLNIENYFRVYGNSYNVLNQIAKDINYTPENLIIPEETDNFLDYALMDPTPGEINNDDLRTINSINERKKRLTENNLIISSSFSLTNDERINLFDENFSIFRSKIEFAGNVLSGISNLMNLNKNSNGRYEIFNVAYSQFVKTEFDYIKHWDLGNKNVLAVRAFLGLAIPYGNSTNIPFSKSFFAGGANDNRAWTAYRLGPGSTESTNEFNEANSKLALSLEHRFNLFDNLNGAVFIDAGNIWNLLDDVEDPNATFTGFNSLKDIAVGSGIGLRYDFSFFVFRFDIGFKTYEPSYQDKNRWFNNYNFSNAVYNIGINYPF